MTVLSSKLHWKGSTGSVSRSGGNESGEYTAVYQVTTDSALDQTRTIVDYFIATAGLPSFGDFYAYGTDIDYNSILRKITPERSDKSAFHWFVKLGYEPKTDPGSSQAKPGPSGEPTNDPNQWIREYEVSYYQTNVPCWKAIYRGNSKGTNCFFLPEGAEMVPQNSALVPFEPALEKEQDIRVVRVTKWFPVYDGQEYDKYIGRVNSQPLALSSPPWYGFSDFWKAQQARIKGITGSAQWIDLLRRFWWKIVFEVHINPLGWRDQVPDRGILVRALPGDPDGKGGTFTTSDFVDGEPRHAVAKDKDGVPLPEPILLDGNGAPLHKNATIEDAVFLIWQKYEEIPFYSLGL